MTRPTPKWGLWFAFDVLLDVGLMFALLGVSVGQWRAGSVVGSMYGVAATAFIFGMSLLVRGAIVPLVRGDREIRRMTEAPRHRRSRR